MIGADVVDIERLRRALARSPGLESRLFTASESSYCRSKPDPVRSLAGMLAAKEAVMKAAGLRSLPAWARRVQVSHRTGGAPAVTVDGRSGYVVSISHDGGVAFAVALSVQTN
jgi:phosphopantetheine--protein transferase-like protein